MVRAVITVVLLWLVIFGCFSWMGESTSNDKKVLAKNALWAFLISLVVGGVCVLIVYLF
jgi:hypothetical protein